MYRLVWGLDHDKMFDTCATPDGAIVRAKQLTDLKMDPNSEDWPPVGEIIVLDGQSMRGGAVPRIRAVNGRAWWLAPCKPCRKTGKDGFENCKHCLGLGYANDLPAV